MLSQLFSMFFLFLEWDEERIEIADVEMVSERDRDRDRQTDRQTQTDTEALAEQ